METKNITPTRVKLTTMRKVLNGLKWDEPTKWGEYNKATQFINLTNKYVQLNNLINIGLISKQPYEKGSNFNLYSLTKKGRKVREMLNELYSEMEYLINWY